LVDLANAVTSISRPVLLNGKPGQWDSDCAGFGSIVRTVDGKLRMYYTGQNGVVTAIGAAESNDGIHWEKHPGNPVLKGDMGAWDEKRCDLPTVWYEHGEYRMIYRGVNRLNEVRVGLAVSFDGDRWVKCDANPVWDDPNSWAHGHNEPWGLLKYRDEYVMFYTNLYPRDPHKGGWVHRLKGKVGRLLAAGDYGGPGTIRPREVGCAGSKDLMHWQSVSDSPVFRSSGDPADWNYAQICPYVFRYSEAFYMLLICRPASGRPTRMELYRCSNPYFRETERTLVGVLFSSKEKGWEAPFLDTPFVFSEDISRTLDAGAKDVRVYYTAGRSGSLQTGMFSFPVEILKS
jgi:hypothetical protein